MIDQHTLAILLRGIAADTSNQYLSISAHVTCAEALDSVRTIGQETGFTRHSSARYDETSNRTHVSIALPLELEGKYIHLTCEHSGRYLADQLNGIFKNSHCIRCSTYLGPDCHEHGVVAHCNDCAEHLDIGEPEARGRSYFDHDPVDLELV